MLGKNPKLSAKRVSTEHAIPAITKLKKHEAFEPDSSFRFT